MFCIGHNETIGKIQGVGVGWWWPPLGGCVMGGKGVVETVWVDLHWLHLCCIDLGAETQNNHECR